MIRRGPALGKPKRTGAGRRLDASRGVVLGPPAVRSGGPGDAMIRGHLIVIGAMKAGTTTLFELLARHPDLVRGHRKELDHFQRRRWAGPEGYDALFADAPHDRPVLTLDASPGYAKEADRSPAPARIAALRRPVHLVYLLRDPVERAISHVRHNMARGRIAPADLPGLDLRRYARTSRYCAQIRAYEAVGLGDRLLLVDFEALCREPGRVVADVCRHAGIAPIAVPGALHANRNDQVADEVGGLDVAALGRMLRTQRRRMIRRHGFEPARAWAVHDDEAALGAS